MENGKISERNWPHTASPTAKRFSSTLSSAVAISDRSEAAG